MKSRRGRSDEMHIPAPVAQASSKSMNLLLDWPRNRRRALTQSCKTKSVNSSVFTVSSPL